MKLARGRAAARRRAAGGILRAAGARPDGLDDGPRPGEAVARHVADSLSALELPFVRAARADRRPRLGRRLAGPRAGRRAAGRARRLVESAIRHCRYLERAVEVVRARQRHRRQRPRGDVAGGHRRPRPHDRPRARRAAGDPRVRGAAAGRRRARRGLEGRRHRARRPRPVPPPPAILGLEPLAGRRRQPFPGARDHTLHVSARSRPRRTAFPRRPGMATKRPLGLSGRRPSATVSRETRDRRRSDRSRR